MREGESKRQSTLRGYHVVLAIAAAVTIASFSLMGRLGMLYFPLSRVLGMAAMFAGLGIFYAALLRFADSGLLARDTNLTYAMALPYALAVGYWYWAAGEARGIMLIEAVAILVYVAGHSGFLATVVYTAAICVPSLVTCLVVASAGSQPIALREELARLTCTALLGVLIAVFAERFRRLRTRNRELAGKLRAAHEQLERFLPPQLVDAVIAGATPAIPGYRRELVTVFFSDIRKFTDLAESLEPEATGALLNEYMAAMIAIAGRFGGIVDKFVGDGILIFFGASLPASEGAERCVRMALEMQSEMPSLRGRLEARGVGPLLDLSIRIGINTGLAVVGNFGTESRMDHTVIGLPVNIAARLQGHAEPGTVLLSESTWRLVKEAIPCVARGDVALKGVLRPVRIYEVGPRPARDGTGSAATNQPSAPAGSP
jgi:class 3 adenylate cyclase